MKKFLPLGFALLASAAMAQSPSESQEIKAVAVSSISNNGEWLVGETATGSLKIVNLKTGKEWRYNTSGNDNDEGYVTGSNLEVSNDGVVVGEVNSIPSYWENGEWKQLKGWIRDDSGYVYAVVGAITPDGSMIVGGLGKGGGSIYNDEDIQLTYPCVWYRQSDGTYGDPVWLPNPGKDIFNRIPQYVHCLSVSNDGKTIGAMMRDGFGGFCQPYAFTLDENGDWKYTALGYSLINPNNIPIEPFPGEYNGSNYPNYELYMTSAELSRFNSKADAWMRQQADLGYSEEQIEYMLLFYAKEFMSGEKLIEYTAALDEWNEEFTTWENAWTKYEDCVIELFNTGYSFEFNNIFLSPDGKYIYSSAKPQNDDNYTPVRIEIASDKNLLYPNEYNIIVSSIASDYTILGHAYSADSDLYQMAYIFPEGDTTPISIVDFFKNKEDKSVYNWMEEHMYQEVVTGITSTGAEQYDDEWCLGKPVCTPDLSLIGFAVSTLYWATPPAGSDYITFLVDTGMKVNGVEEVAAVGEADVIALRNGLLEIKGEVNAISVYNLSGLKVYEAANPAGVVSTGLSNGVYVIRTSTASGKVLTKKILF